MIDSIKTPENMQEEENVDFLALAKTLWIGRKTILICLFIGLVFGIIVALSTTNQYTARTVLVPQVKSSTKSSLSSLAALAGVDLGMTESTDLSPLIYPKIVNSIPFNIELMNTPVHFQSLNKPVTIFDYYTKIKKPNIFAYIAKYTIGLPSLFINFIRPKEEELRLSKGVSRKSLYMTKKQLLVKKMLDKTMQLAVEKKDGYLTLSVSSEDPVVAAELTQKAQQMLQDFITEFKVEKSRAELDFIQGRYNIAKSEAEGFQFNMATNLDKYKNLTSNIPQVSNSRIQTKYAIANSVYLDLAKQLEQAKIQVKRDTPVFTVIEPVCIPSEKSNRGKVFLILVWSIGGIFIGMVLILGKQWFVNFRKQWADVANTN